MRLSLKRALTCALASAAVTAGAVAATSSPAMASANRAVVSSSWAYIDSRSPDSVFVDQLGDAPVGAWLDGESRYHTSRSYFSFDLTPLLGKRIIDVNVAAGEIRVAECGKRAVELWVTDDVTSATSWRNPPAQRQHLGTRGPEIGCPIARMYWDATDAIRQAVAAGRSTVTLALRNPDGQEHSLEYGRHFAAAVSLGVTYNTAPDVPTNLRTGDSFTACSTEAPGRFLRAGGHGLYAHMTDPDPADGAPEQVAGRFAVWPVDSPDQRRELTTLPVSVPWDVGVTMPTDLAVHGRSYAWQVQADDGVDTSPWSHICYFTYDLVAPAAAPSVSSVDYPDGEWSGGVGIPGTFTFSADGDTDVIGFHYRDGLGGSTYVATDQPGGSAQVIITPERNYSSLFVASADRADNRSTERTYEIRANDTAPIVVGPRIVQVGEQAEFSFSPGMADVVEYHYWFNNEPPTVVAAGSDGTARVTVSKPLGDYVLNVRSRTSAGLLSGVYKTVFAVTDEPVT